MPLLKLAAEKGHGRCVRVLLAEENFDPNACKSDGVTALHIAARYGHIRYVRACGYVCVCVMCGVCIVMENTDLRVTISGDW